MVGQHYETKIKLVWPEGKKWNSTNKFLQRFAETFEENFLLLPKKTMCSLPKHENSLIEILKIFNRK